MDLSTFISAISTAIDMLNLSKDSKIRTVEALTSLQIAIIKTKEHIENQGYEANSELSQLWFDAFAKVQRARLITDYYDNTGLFRKGQFWGDPNKWIQERSSLELVPKLKDLEMHCDSLITKMNDL